MPKTRFVIAVDGPSGAGKSTICRALAARLGFTYIDTGAMYRCVGLAAREAGIDADDRAGLEALCHHLDIRFAPANGENRVLLDGRDVSPEIRTPASDTWASAVSRVPEVRRALVALQRRLGEAGRVILEGRDAGTVIFPDAELKIYLDADLAVRARRRHAEQTARGHAVTLAEVERDIARRDLSDSTRDHAPLRQATDARRLDTSNLDTAAVIAAIARMIEETEGTGNQHGD
ncbi:MAG: (d)CMP kinase [Deltaproteobacteria bacterium]|nr:(d)CMP kinase [Candidatus Anaeroferrophillacea bacterium]